MDPCLSLITNSKMGVLYISVLNDVQQTRENVLNVFTIISIIWFYARLTNHCREEAKEFHMVSKLKKCWSIAMDKSQSAESATSSENQGPIKMNDVLVPTWLKFLMNMRAIVNNQLTPETFLLLKSQINIWPSLVTQNRSPYQLLHIIHHHILL